MAKESDYSPGKHPKSLANLQHEGRPKDYSEAKKSRAVSVTPSGWEGCQAIAKNLGCRGISQLLEKIGRGELIVIEPPKE